MTPTPPSHGSSLNGNSPDYRVVRKRNRIPLSCGPCRQRKLKCNRQQPCDNCGKRGDSPSCTYAAPTARKKGSTSSLGSNATPDDMQNRIDRLEGLVLSLMTNGAQSAGPSAAAQAISAASSSMGSGSLGPNLDSALDDSSLMDADGERGEDESETDGVTQSFGILKVDAEKQKTFYLGEAHWAALLSEIGEVKNYFTTHKREYEAQMEKVAQARKTEHTDVGAGPALLFGASTPPSRSEILSQLPSKYTCDILIARYFNTFDPAISILHGPAFKRQYEAYWQDPSRTSIVWIAMLFAMLRLSMISYGRDGDEPPEFKGKCNDMAYTYRTQMAHCLITADYTKPHNFVIETLIFHLHAEYSSNKDSEASVWVLSGMITRLAMRMGYHRDSKLFPNITAFQGEMRRRVWTFVRSADLLFSFQLALPSMIRIGDSDTDLPRNIYDNEFDEDSQELPPSRPASEATPVSYLIAKGRLAFGFAKVLEEVNGIEKHSYEEILKVDKGLQEVYHGIPDHLKVRPMSEQQLSPMTLIMARFSLATVYHKSQCVLHRRFMKLVRGNNKYMHSRRMCIDSAMQLLSFHAIQHEQTQEKGRMRTLKKYVNSLSTHDFLLAASVIGMDLYKSRERPESDISTPSTSVSGSISQGSASTTGSGDACYVPGLPYTRDDLTRTLEQSRDIWYANRDISIEAFKASEMLNVLITYLKQPYSPSQANLPMPNLQSSNMNGNTSNNNDEQTAAMTLGMLQSGGVAPNSAQAAAAAQLAQQAQQQGLAWDNNSNKNNNPTMNTFLAGDQNSQMFSNQNFGSPGYLGEGSNAGFPLFGPVGSVDVSMSFDWDNWDQYMSSNLGLDPASNLWSNTSPNSSNIFNQPTPNTDTSTTNPTGNGSGNDSSFGMNNNFFTQSGSGMGGDMSKQEGMAQQGNNGNNGSNMSGDAGDTFMGVQTPGPSGVGMGGWKWTVMSGDKS